MKLAQRERGRSLLRVGSVPGDAAQQHRGAAQVSGAEIIEIDRLRQQLEPGAVGLQMKEELREASEPRLGLR